MRYEWQLLGVVNGGRCTLQVLETLVRSRLSVFWGGAFGNLVLGKRLFTNHSALIHTHTHGETHKGIHELPNAGREY
jgi:hypothetical protein